MDKLIKQITTSSLALVEPWYVESVIFDSTKNQINIYVNVRKYAPFSVHIVAEPRNATDLNRICEPGGMRIAFSTRLSFIVGGLVFSAPIAASSRFRHRLSGRIPGSPSCLKGMPC